MHPRTMKELGQILELDSGPPSRGASVGRVELGDAASAPIALIPASRSGVAPLGAG